MSLLVLACLVIGTGTYLKWFDFSSRGEGEKTTFSVTVDKEKIKADVEQAQQKAKEWSQKKDKASGGTATDEAKGE
jgi:hypothetical protein